MKHHYQSPMANQKIILKEGIFEWNGGVLSNEDKLGEAKKMFLDEKSECIIGSNFVEAISFF